MTNRQQTSGGQTTAAGDHLAELGVGERQLLSRLCQAGGGRARQALATILGESEVQVDLYEAGLQEHSQAAGEVAGGAERMIAVLFELSGSFQGHLTLLLSEPSADVLVERLLPGTQLRDEAGAYTADANGVLAEVGNIVASAFLNAFADALRTPWLPSTPQLIHDQADAIVAAIAGRGIAAQALAIALDAQIKTQGQRVRGQLLFLPSAPVLASLLRAAGG